MCEKNCVIKLSFYIKKQSIGVGQVKKIILYEKDCVIKLSFYIKKKKTNTIKVAGWYLHTSLYFYLTDTLLSK